MAIAFPKIKNITAAIEKKKTTAKKKNSAIKKLAKLKKITFKKIKKP